MNGEASRPASLRVAFVHSSYSAANPSGENRVVEAEAAALERRGVDVHLAASSTDDLKREPFYRARAAGRVATGSGRHPLEELQRFRPDVVHVHNVFPNYGRRWVEAIDVPVVHTLHNYRPICAAGTLFRDGDVCTLCPEGQWRSSLVYACYRDSRFATLPLTIANWGGPDHDPLLRRADRTIMLSDRQRRMYALAGMSDDQVVVWPNFLPDDLDPGRRATEAKRTDGWLFVGRLSAEKGITELVARWPSEVSLTVIGSGPSEELVRRRAVGKDVRFLGQLGRADVARRMARSTGLVFPSRAPETFGLVYIEALACGLPVLALGANAVSDAVARDGTGAVGTWDEDLAALLGDVAASFGELRERCRAVFEAEYTEDHHVERALGLYEELIGARRHGGPAP